MITLHILINLLSNFKIVHCLLLEDNQFTKKRYMSDVSKSLSNLVRKIKHNIILGKSIMLSESLILFDTLDVRGYLFYVYDLNHGFVSRFLDLSKKKGTLNIRKTSDHKNENTYYY